jgi:sucrose phosphorylase
MIYNFTLPPLILYALATGNGAPLTAWAGTLAPVSPRATYLNITATHDGIGMRPTEGLLSESQRQLLMTLAKEHHGDITGKRNSDGSISPYELNLNYFDAVNHPDADEPLALQRDRFLLSQAIPLALLGIPGIYLHSLLGSRNDLAGVRRTGRARSINREQLQCDAVLAALADPAALRAQVCQRYCHLLDTRRQQPAFHPDAAQTVLDLGPRLFAVQRTHAATGDTVLAVHNLTAQPDALRWPAGGHDLLTGEHFAGPAQLPLAPYQVRWLHRRQ